MLHNLASKETGFGGLFKALDRAAAQGANVAEQQAHFFVDLDTFFSRVGVGHAAARTSDGGRSAVARQAIYSLPHQAPLLEKAATFMRLLRPSADRSRRSRPFAHAFSVGTTNLKAAESLTTSPAATAKSLERFAKNPIVILALEEFTRTAELGGPAARRARARAGELQLPDAHVPQPRERRVARTSASARSRASPFLLAPVGPNSEGFPSSVATDGPSQEKGSGGRSYNNNFLH